jgi:hypothetical protein
MKFGSAPTPVSFPPRLETVKLPSQLFDQRTRAALALGADDQRPYGPLRITPCGPIFSVR